MPKFCPALACIFVVIVLLTAAPAAAQEVWSATLTVAEFSSLLGYKGPRNNNFLEAAVVSQ